MLKIVAAVIFLTVNVVMVSTASSKVTSQAPLIMEINKQRAKLNKGGYSKIEELAIPSGDVSAISGKVDCTNLNSGLVTVSEVSAKAFYSKVAAASSTPTEAQLIKQIETDVATAKTQVGSDGICISVGKKCGLADTLLPRKVTKMSFWTSDDCDSSAAKDYRIIYMAGPTGKVGESGTMNTDGACSAAFSDQEFPKGSSGTKLCQETMPTKVTAQAPLIMEINKQRAKLNKGGYSMIEELVIASGEVDGVAGQVKCSALTGGLVVLTGGVDGKAFYSKVTAATATPNEAQLIKQIETDVGTAKTQVGSDGICISVGKNCGLADTLLPRKVTKMSFWDSGNCGTSLAKDYKLIYIAGPSGKVGESGTMNTDGACSAGFTDQEYPMGSSGTKLCQKSVTTAAPPAGSGTTAPPAGSGTTAPPKGSGTLVLANPLLLLFAFLATVFRG